MKFSGVSLVLRADRSALTCAIPYSLKISSVSLLALPVGVAAALLWLLHGGPGGERTYSDVLSLFEVYFPLLAVVSVAPLIPLEIDEGTFDLLMSTPVRRWVLLVHRVGPALAVYILCYALVAGFAYLHCLAYPLTEVLWYTLPQSLLLAGLSVLVGLAWRSMIGAYCIPLLYWVVSYILGARFLGIFYLFQASRPDEDLTIEPTKIALLISALAVLVINLAIIEKRRNIDG